MFAIETFLPNPGDYSFVTNGIAGNMTLKWWINSDPLAENGMSGLLLERMISCVLTEDFDVRHWLKDHGWEDHGTEVVAFGLSGLMGLVYTWYYDGFRKPAEEMAALAEQLLWPYGDSRK